MKSGHSIGNTVTQVGKKKKKKVKEWKKWEKNKKGEQMNNQKEV